MLESGVRFHLTKYVRDKNDLPSPIAMKFRKHLRTKRLEEITQLGHDRVVIFKFGSGDMVTHVILELYSSGNIILADGNYVVLALLRSHQFEDNAAIQVGHVYPVAYTHTEHKDVDQTTFISFLSLGDFCNSSTWLKSKCLVPDAEDGATNKKKKSKKCTLHQVLLSRDSGVSSFGPEVIDHCILMAELEPSVKVDELILLLEKSPESYQKLANSLACAPSLIDRLNAPNEPGYILCEDNNTNKYVDYTPYRFRQYESGTEGRLLKFDSFNDAVDEYYCRVSVRIFGKILNLQI